MSPRDPVETTCSSPLLDLAEQSYSFGLAQGSSTGDIELAALDAVLGNPIPGELTWSGTNISAGNLRGSSCSTENSTSSSCDGATTPAHPPGKPSIIKQLLLDSWACEIFAMSFSIACLVAIISIVEFYDGKRIPRLKSGLTLNTIISILSTSARSGLILVISTILGQLKWCWLMRSSRKIQDIQDLDNASRGPLGAMSIIIYRIGGSFAALASAVSLLVVAFSPFLQQLVDYPLRNATQSEFIALAPRNLAYTSFFEDTYAGEPGLARIIEIGTWSAPRRFDREPSCPTGRCSWTNFTSVGWCSKCEDRTHSASLHNCKIDDVRHNKTSMIDYCVLDLGSGFNTSVLGYPSIEGTVYSQPVLNYARELIWSMGRGGFAAESYHDYSDWEWSERKLSVEGIGFLGVGDPLVILGHATIDSIEGLNGSDTRDSNVLRVEEASQCILTLCEKTLSLNKADGLSTWTDESTNYGKLVLKNGSSQHVVSGDPELCWQAEEGELDFTYLGNGRRRVDKDKRAFCPVSDYAYSVEQYLTDRAFIPLTDLYGNIPVATAATGSARTVGSDSTRKLSERLRSIADALTNFGLEQTNDTIRGTATASESYVNVRWRWIVLPALLESATLGLLILTIIYSRRERVPLWKSSVLALLGVASSRDQETLIDRKLSSIELVANTSEIQLVERENGMSSLVQRRGTGRLV